MIQKAFLISIFSCLLMVMQTSEAQTLQDPAVGQTHFQEGMSRLEQKADSSKREALSLFETAAKEGHSGAAFHAAVMYERGIGTPKDMSKAFQYYLQAAEGGDINAMFTISKLYSAEAHKWHEKAQSGSRGDRVTSDATHRHK